MKKLTQWLHHRERQRVETVRLVRSYLATHGFSLTRASKALGISKQNMQKLVQSDKELRKEYKAFAPRPGPVK